MSPKLSPYFVLLSKLSLMNKPVLLLILCLFILSTAKGQYYDTGQDPASLRWLQIRTPHFRVIYPSDFGDNGSLYARYLEESFEKLSPLFPGVRRKMPVIIHNHSMQSNGYVTWAPRRMELYPLPGQDNLPASPQRQLSVHETAHFMQISSLERWGKAGFLRYIMGEQAVVLDLLPLPLWALEGDAVYAETATGLSGRGRSNAFIRSARALAARPEGIWRYDKMLSGSFRDFTPDHYIFGYLMMNHLRTFTPGILPEAIYHPTTVWQADHVNAALRREAGLTKKRLYDSLFASAGKIWNSMQPEVVRDYSPLSVKARKEYVNHHSPQQLPDGRIISLKTSLSFPSRFVITDPLSSAETNLTTTGIVYPYIFSLSGNTIVWSELWPDIRWENRDFSVIKKMDVTTGIITTLTRRSRYTAPHLSPDGRTIVAISTTPDMRCSLLFLDALTGEVVMDVVPPDNLILQRPAWSSDGRQVTMVTLSDEGEGIRSYMPVGKRWRIDLKEQVTDIVQARIYNDTLYFLAQGNGADNIYRISPDSPAESITASRFGVGTFSISEGRLLFTDYTTEGFIIASEKSSATGSPARLAHAIPPEVAPFPDVSDDAEMRHSNDEDQQTLPGPVPYRKSRNLFNIHSWFPFYADIDKISTDLSFVAPGLTLLSQNHLSTLSSTAGYSYSNGNHHLHSGFRWSGWHPVIEAGITYGGNPIVTADSSATEETSFTGRALQIDARIYEQIRLSRGKFRQLIMPALYLNYRNNHTWLPGENRYDTDTYTITGRLYISNLFRYAYRDFNPRWGQVVDLRLTTAPWNRQLYNSSRYARTILFFPGAYPNHSLILRGGYENQAPARLMIYHNSLSWPRGLKHTMIAEKLTTLSVDYSMPLLYPDLAAGSIFYLKRVRGTLFYDFARGEKLYDTRYHTFTAEAENFSSAGAELLADFYLLRLPYEISAGARGGYLPGERRFFVSGLFSLNIYGVVIGREQQSL